MNDKLNKTTWGSLHQTHMLNIHGSTYLLKDRLKRGVNIVLPLDITLQINRLHYGRRRNVLLMGQILTGDSVNFIPALTLIDVNDICHYTLYYILILTYVNNF